MYLAGFSINNLTLMALTVATGFVVDDAIVMIENIARHIEDGETAMRAALKGAAQIGFTLVSLTLSLIAVLIPLLFMSDVIGRLFREFAITLAVAILMSLAISLTLTPMMCARLLKADSEQKFSRLQQVLGDGVDGLIRWYDHGLKWVLSHQRLTLWVALATFVVTGLLYALVPKGFFTQHDPGLLQAISQAPQTVSFGSMAERQQKAVNLILKDPDVAAVTSFIGIDGTNATLNTGRMQIVLKPAGERDDNAQDIIRRLGESLHGLAGIRVFMQAVQDLSIDDRVSRTHYQKIGRASCRERVCQYV